MRNVLKVACLLGLLVCGDLARSAAQDPGLRIATKPENPLIEQDHGAQLLNFDFILKNGSLITQHHNRIQVSVFDRSGKLVLRRALDENGGSSAGINTVGQRDVPPHQVISIFNPFFAVDSTVAFGRMVYELFFVDAGTEMAPPHFQTAGAIQICESQLPFLHQLGRLAVPFSAWPSIRSARARCRSGGVPGTGVETQTFIYPRT